ncbi:ABC transporter ATP-binding protein [Bacteriovorax sp. Seq25_V]|uniref:ABC transporter ATP-binding protein n=1 Tax=Bacteriovorax sp. Seq25_V TaxID=1201288 RepID=UPI00038A532A|nr:ABC transporter ATP-binding protein [Bacteriovorax sp. Seq25_V]EQC43849.1 ABC transporter, ATP-binding protein [Bacteriovorax sp. Seq25_V]
MENSPLSSLWVHFKTKRAKVIEASIYSVLNKIFDIAPPILIGLAVDTVVKKESSFVAELGVKNHLHQMYVLGFLTFLIWALESFFEFLLKVRWRHIAQEVQHSLRMETYEHLQKLHISFFENQNTGNLTTVLNDDINQLERFLDVGANEILQVLTTVISIGTIFFFISPTIASLSFLPVPFILWGSFYFQRKIAPKYMGVREEAGLLASMLVNNLSGMMTIKSYVAQVFERNRIDKQSLSYSNSNKRAIVLSSSFSPLIRMVVLCGFLFALVLGGIYVFEGKIEVGAYSVLIFLVQRLLWPLTRLGETFDLYQRAMASTSRVLELLSTVVRINDGKDTISHDDFKGDLEFQDVGFSYDTGAKVLENINIKIPNGKTVALVGTTGSGKSTILKLLLRFYDVTTGKITVDGKDIRDLKQDNLRSLIGFVSQDTYLFHGTVRDNILYGSFDRSEEDLINAAKMAEAYDFIKNLPEGFETIVGERGQKLSGGQRQRISIARALVKNPHLFIFDEATSAVDNETEAAIQRSLENITKERTTVMVAHRLSTIKHADIIYVLERGVVIEQGTHEELLENKKMYYALWNVQTGNLSNN